MKAPMLGWYGDDFTGATDTLAVVAQAGLRSMLFMGVPDEATLAAAGTLDAVGIAGAARAMAPEAMRVELTSVAKFFRRIAPPVLHYKICSTFDSAPDVGNIACAINTLQLAVESPWVPIVGGQPSLNRYCVFSHLFASAGTGGEVHRIDRHPTMSRHPVTPMDEADLRIHLASQGLKNINAVHYPDYDLSESELNAKLLALQMQYGAHHTLCPTLLDLTSPNQLSIIGRLIWQQAQVARLLAVGSSGVAQALVAHWSESQSLAAPVHAVLEPVTTPVLAWAGSLSALTCAQVSAATSYLRIPVDAQRLCQDPAYVHTVLSEICSRLESGQHVLAYTAPADRSMANVANASHVALASAALIAQVVRARAEQNKPLRRLGIAGGDTSSQAVKALQLWGLSFQSTLCKGVTMSKAHSTDPALNGMEIMLKGGQMGGEDLFQQLLG